MKTQYQTVSPKTAVLPFAFWLVWGSVLLDGLGKFVVTFLGLYLVNERQFSIEQTTFIMSAFGIASIPSALLGGVMSDRVGHRNTVIFGFWGSALALSFLGIARQFEHIVAMALCLGLLLRLNKPAITALVTEIVPIENRKRAYQLNYWAGNLGAVVAMPVAGILAGIEYQLLFVGDALTAFGAGTLLWLFLRKSVSLAAHKDTVSPQIPSETVEHDPLLWMIAFGVFLFSCIYAQINLTLPLDMQNKGISEAEFGMILALNPLIIVLFQVPVAQRINHFTHSTLLASGALLLGVGFAMHTWATNPLTYIIPVLIWTVGEMIFFPTALALVAEIAPPTHRARYQGIFYTAWGSLHFIGLSLGGLLLTQWGAPIVWGTCLAVGIIVMAIFLLVRSTIQERVVHTPIK